MREYKCLNKQEYNHGEYKLTPIRYEDRYEIMKWRNEQLYHLRQAELLTIDEQDAYFENVVNGLFDQEKPDQILFSFLKCDELVGYGGLVHINWVDKNAEISFIMDTKHEKKSFSMNWSKFLNCIERVAFKNIGFHKIFVYAFDLRPNLYVTLESNKYFLDARLKDHCFFDNGFKDVVIYSKIKKQ